VDFGTCNTVLARFNETRQEAETLEIPGITTEMRYRLDPTAPEEIVHVAPSLIHYSETETLIGDQVLSRGLAEHPDTFRWMKRAIAQRSTRRKKTAQGHKSAGEAADEFLRLLINYAADRLSFEEDEFTFTLPVEAFEDFQDWLLRVTEKLRIRRVRLLDEPTACVFGYHGAARQDERFVVFDFGGGTLDVSAVRLDLSSGAESKAIPLGQAGRDLGGMDIDQYLADDFCERHGIKGSARRELDAVIVRQAEAAKIRLSDPAEAEGAMSVVIRSGQAPRVCQTSYVRSCPACCDHARAGRRDEAWKQACLACALCDSCWEQGQPGQQARTGQACLGCLMLANDFAQKARETLDQAIENATVKVGMRRADVTRVLATGGTSLVPCVRGLLTEAFDSRVVYDRPFDTVVRGACRGIVEPVLQHDYAIESFSRERGRYEFKPLFKIGTEYPTAPGAVRLWAKGTSNGMTRIGLKIFEVSRMKRGNLAGSIIGADGRIQEASRVASEYEYICLNEHDPTFIVADPPVNLDRDKQRFLCSLGIDGHRRLIVTVLDNLTGKVLMQDHPVVRL